jgi:hypothetical protein
MTTATAVLATIRGYLGVSENPAHSNQTIIGEKFGWNGVPWCAETVTVCQHEAGNTTFNGSASCSVLVARYQDRTNGEWLGNPGTAGLLPGDEFFLGSRGQDHTGLVESIDGDTVITVEGNWGDKVARVRRPVSAFFGFGRPTYTQPAPPEDDDMTPDQERKFDELYAAIKTPGNGIEDRIARIEACMAPQGRDHADPNALDVQVKELRQGVKAIRAKTGA